MTLKNKSFRIYEEEDKHQPDYLARAIAYTALGLVADLLLIKIMAYSAAAINYILWFLSYRNK